MKPPMDNVVASTTIAEIGRRAGQYGVTQMLFSFNYDDPKGPSCVVALISEGRTAIGTSDGHTRQPIEVAALDDAFARLKHVRAQEITAYGAEVGASAKWDL